MALYWTIDSRKRTVDVVADGDVSMADAMAFFDAVEGANALSYSKLLDGTRARAAMTPDDVLSIIVRIRGCMRSAPWARWPSLPRPSRPSASRACWARPPWPTAR